MCPAPLIAVPRDADLPLSYAQERLWMIQKLDPSSPAYNVPFAMRLVGALRRDLLWRSFAEIVARHEALRTTFPLVRGAPVQRTRPDCGVEPRDVDLEV